MQRTKWSFPLSSKSPRSRRQGWQEIWWLFFAWFYAMDGRTFHFHLNNHRMRQRLPFWRLTCGTVPITSTSPSRCLLSLCCEMCPVHTEAAALCDCAACETYNTHWSHKWDLKFRPPFCSTNSGPTGLPLLRVGTGIRLHFPYRLVAALSMFVLLVWVWTQDPLL